MTVSQRGDWARALWDARFSTNDGPAEWMRFAELAASAKGGGLPEAKALMATLRSVPEDNGEGEAILALLSGFDAPIQARAVLDELPRLSAEGELEWCDCVVETEVRFRTKDLVLAARQSSSAVLVILKESLLRISADAAASGDPDVAKPVLTALGLC